MKAYVGFVKTDGGPWDETHSSQVHHGGDPANKCAGCADLAKAGDGHGDGHGDAERLRRYWAEGEGAAKIRWGEPGDWQRCVDHLGKFIAKPEGYCANLHHRALGSGRPRTPGWNAKVRRERAAGFHLAISPTGC